MKGLINIFNSSDKNITRDVNNADKLRVSNIHNQYSINGDPTVTLSSGKPLPPPSKLDYDGKEPEFKYLANKPEPGARL
jgi:hypothetical protein